MRILLQTRFHPNIGGIETIAMLLADKWTQAGEMVTVCTDVAYDPLRPDEFPFAIHHKPSAAKLVTLVRHNDVVVQMNISLRTIWPLALSRTKLVAVHHGCYFTSRDNRRDW